MSKVKELLNYLAHHDYLPTKYREEIQVLLDNQPEANVIELLVRGGFMESENLARVEAEFFNFPYVNLEDKSSIDFLDLLPFELARDCGAICFDKENESLSLALIFPEVSTIRKLNSWASESGFYLKYYICSLLDYEKELAHYEMIEPAVKDMTVEEKEVSGFEVVPIDKIVNTILTQATTVGAEEIMIDSSSSGVRVRFRLGGLLTTVLSLPLTVKDHLFGFLKGLAQVPFEDAVGIGQLDLIVNKKELRFSLSALKTNEGEKLVIKEISKKESKFDLESLGFGSHLKGIINKGLTESKGKIIIFGETGSGRTTTLYSLLKQLNPQEKHIVSLENSLESNLSGISQLQMKPESGLDYSQAIRGLLRHQPDVVALEEINNQATAESALHLAMTGAHIITSSEASGLVDGLSRLLKLKMDSYHLSSVLNTIIAQRLVKRVCPHCGSIQEMTTDESDFVKQELSIVPREKLPRGIDLSGKLFKMQSDGCSWCDHSGYLGKMAVAEGGSVDEGVRSDLSSVQKKSEIRAALDKLDRLTMYQDGLIKVLQGRTTLDEIVSK